MVISIRFIFKIWRINNLNNFEKFESNVNAKF